MKRRKFDEINQPRLKNWDPNQDEPSAPKVKIEGGIRSQGVKPTCKMGLYDFVSHTFMIPS